MFALPNFLDKFATNDFRSSRHATIGLRAQIKGFPCENGVLFARLASRGEPFDLGYVPWVADFPDPDAMLNQLLETSALYPTFDDATWRHRLAAVGSLSGPERYLTYGKLDIDLTRDAAPLLAFGNTYTHDLFSARIGCQAYGGFGLTPTRPAESVHRHHCSVARDPFQPI